MKLKLCALLTGLLFCFTGCSEMSSDKQLSEGQIINIMMTVDKNEILASQEALKKNANPEVQTYANYLIQEHQKNMDALVQLARQAQTPPSDSDISNTLTSDGKKEVKKLSETQDKDFDKAYIAAMVKDHKDGLNLIDKKLLPHSKNPQLRTSVDAFRKMVAEHLERAEKIEKSL
jgi:putative membrane protein